MAGLLHAACHHCRGTARTVDLSSRCSNAHIVQLARIGHAIGGVVRACGTLWKLMAPSVFRVKPRPTVRMGYRLQQLRPWLWQANQG